MRNSKTYIILLIFIQNSNYVTIQTNSTAKKLPKIKLRKNKREKHFKGQVTDI
jgi:hypothetical protein